MNKKFRVLLVFRNPSVETGAMLCGIARYQQLHGQWSVFVDDDTGPDGFSEQLWGQHWDGVICSHTNPKLVHACRERKLPLVDLADGPAFPGVPQIRPDNVAVGHMAAEDLSERGYMNFGFCGFSNALWSRERRNGFVEGLTLMGKSCAVLESENSCRYSPQWQGEQIPLLAAWLKKQRMPLAVMACNDFRAVQILEAAKFGGLSVPGDLAVLGVNDDRPCCEMAQPMLSSIALDSSRAGYLAADTLIRLMRGESAGISCTLVEPATVVHRQSTGVLAFDDPRLSVALQYIRDNACRGITVEHVLTQVGMHRHVLERGLRKYIGRSPQAEIRRVQLVEIKRLLRQTDKPLKDIADSTGFEYVEYMCVLFKRLVGETPGRFRKNASMGLTPRLMSDLEMPDLAETGLLAKVV